MAAFLFYTMPNNCSVYGCFNTKRRTKQSDSNIRYYRFPKNEKQRQIWINMCRRADKINPDHAVICSVHFTVDDLKDDAKSRLLGTATPRTQRVLKDDAVPSLFLPHGKLTELIVYFYIRRTFPPQCRFVSMWVLDH